jgi:two-component system LytT family response regulator
MIRSILIDDEKHCLDTLRMSILKHCPEVQIIDQCTSSRKALAAIHNYRPDLIFLDIEMPIMNGFELLEELGEISFSIIFTTGYDQYAIKAIRFSALDYLLKPIIPGELINAVQKVRAHKLAPSAEQLSMLLNQIHHLDNNFTKVAVPTAEGFELIPTEQLVRCEANNTYTHLYLKNKTKIIACRTLKEIEEQLQEFSSFIRVHHSYLVNLNDVTKYIRGDGGYLVMSDGTTVSVSKNRKDNLLKKLHTPRR